MKKLICLSLLLFTGCAHSPITPSWKGNVSPLQGAIMRIANNNKDVSVAIYGESAFVVSDKQMIADGFDPDAWRKAKTTQFQTALEQAVLGWTSKTPTFHLVDRMTLNRVMEELRFSLSGALSQQIRVKIGELTGANYLILFDETLYPDRTRQATVRLIALESGEVLSSQSTEVKL